ncbi:MAG: cadherin-like domain-containing protein, partial [Pseudomonadota bacterium]
SDDVESTLDAVDDVFTIDEDMTLQGNVIANDTAADPSALRSVLVNGEILPQGQALTEIALANGTLAINRLGDFVYTPNTDFFGVETFNYTARDGSTQSDDATVTITVNPVQDAPVAVDDLFSTTQDTPVSGNILLNDSDADGDALRSIIVERVVLAPGLAPTEVALEDGTLQINRLGEFIYTPDDDFTGEEEFTYEVRDGNGGSDEATVTVSVDPVPLVEGRALKLDFRNNRKILNEKVNEDGRDNGLSFVDVDPGAEVLGEGILDNRGGNGLSLFKFDSLGPISHTEAVRVHKPEGIGIGRDRIIDDDDILSILLIEDEANGAKLQFGNPNGFYRDGDLDPGEMIEVELFLDSEKVFQTFFTHDPNASGSLRSLSLDELDGFDGTTIFDEIHVSAASGDTEFTLRDITIFTVVPDPDFV